MFRLLDIAATTLRVGVYSEQHGTQQQEMDERLA
jgi:hypothetical protein